MGKDSKKRPAFEDARSDDCDAAPVNATKKSRKNRPRTFESGEARLRYLEYRRRSNEYSRRCYQRKKDQRVKLEAQLAQLKHENEKLQTKGDQLEHHLKIAQTLVENQAPLPLNPTASVMSALARPSVHASWPSDHVPGSVSSHLRPVVSTSAAELTLLAQFCLVEQREQELRLRLLRLHANIDAQLSGIVSGSATFGHQNPGLPQAATQPLLGPASLPNAAIPSSQPAAPPQQELLQLLQTLQNSSSKSVTMMPSPSGSSY